MAALSSDPAQMIGMNSSQCTQEPSQENQVEGEESRNSQVDGPVTQDEFEPVEAANLEETEASAEPSLPKSSLKRQASAISLNEGSSFSGQDHFVKSFNSTPGYLANRWNNVNSSFSSPSASQKPAFTTPNAYAFFSAF